MEKARTFALAFFVSLKMIITRKITYSHGMFWKLHLPAALVLT
jgi:hypothetical protein